MSEKEIDVVEVRPKARTLDNLLVLKITYEDGKVTEKSFTGTRVGLSWPNPKNPGGYFVMVGQEAKKSIMGIAPLWVVSEYKGPIFENTITKMFNEMGSFGCFEIFSDVSDRYRSHIQALEFYRRNHRSLQSVRLKEAPYFDDFILGSNAISKWIKVIKGLTIPKKFYIHSQLREMRSEDLKGKPEEEFFAVNALRYVLEAFETSEIPQSTSNRVQDRGLPPGAWT